jgi:hypothetical protein
VKSGTRGNYPRPSHSVPTHYSGAAYIFLSPMNKPLCATLLEAPEFTEAFLGLSTRRKPTAPSPGRSTTPSEGTVGGSGENTGDRGTGVAGQPLLEQFGYESSDSAPDGEPTTSSVQYTRDELERIATEACAIGLWSSSDDDDDELDVPLSKRSATGMPGKLAKTASVPTPGVAHLMSEAEDMEDGEWNARPRKPAKGAASRGVQSMLDKLRRQKRQPSRDRYPNARHDVVDEAEKQLAAMPDIHSQAARHATKDQGTSIQPQELVASLKQAAALAVARVMPPEAMATIVAAEGQPQKFANKDADAILRAIRRKCDSYEGGGMLTRVSTFLRFLEWLDVSNIPFSDVDKEVISDFLEFVHEQATSEEAGGTTAAGRVKAQLATLYAAFHFPQGAPEALAPYVDADEYGGPVQAKPVSIEDMEAIGRYAGNPSTPLVLRSIAGAFHYKSFAAGRTKQMQHMGLDGREGEFCYGVDKRRKTPRVEERKGKPMLHVCVFKGVYNGEEAFQYWLDDRPAEAENVGSAYLDYRGPTSSADPREATELLNAPMPDSKINSAIRVMLQEACGMSKEQAAGYSKHSARHFLPQCAFDRGEPIMRQLEIGKWCGSTLAMHTLAPGKRWGANMKLKAAHMPNMYSDPNGLVQRVGSIMLAQVQSCRRFLARTDRNNDQHDGSSFKLLDRYDAVRDGE